MGISNHPSDFIVVDTEGRDFLREIAIIDADGQLIYEAFTLDSPQVQARLNHKPLAQILEEFQAIAKDKIIVCHYAEHDHKVINQSYRVVQKVAPTYQWQCTIELAKRHLSQQKSYALEYLSRHLSLQVNNRYFEADQAHSARYDALFTYQLYIHMLGNAKKSTINLKPYLNPFASSRVDNPFQSHLDLTSISQEPYEGVKAILNEITTDPNHQSRGVVITGEAGTGKSHLMMRLAQERLAYNRLFFINHPNDPDGILFHIYSRVLESLIKKVGNTEHTQLEFLLAHFLAKIINKQEIQDPSKKESQIIEILKKNPLDIYQKLGEEGSVRKRDLWSVILKKVQLWWQLNHEISGSSLQILIGIIRYCYYTDSARKMLVKRWLAGYELEEKELNLIGLAPENWTFQGNRETLALEALIVFGKLSLLDEPLIIVFDQLESLGLQHNSNLLVAFGQNLKELFTQIKNSLIISIMFPESWDSFRDRLDASITDRQGQFQFSTQPPDRQTLEKLLELHLEDLPFSLNALFQPNEKEDILAQKTIRKVINRAADYYRLKRDNIPLPRLRNSPKPKDKSQSILEIAQGLSQVSQTVSDLATQLQALLTVDHSESNKSSKSNESSRVNLPVESSVLTSEITIESYVEPEIETFVDLDVELQQIQNYLGKQQQSIEVEYQAAHHLKIITPSQDRSRLQMILDNCRGHYQLDVDHLRLGNRKVPENLVVAKNEQRYCVVFLYEGGSSFTARLKNLNQLVVANPQTFFVLFRDPESPYINGRVGQQELERFNYCTNTIYLEFDINYRVPLELFEQLIIDIQNRDLEVDLLRAIAAALEFTPQSWVARLLQGEKSVEIVTRNS